MSSKAPARHVNINIKGAEVGGSWAIYFGLFSQRALGGTITEASFSITLPNSNQKAALEIKNAKGHTIYNQALALEDDIDINLTAKDSAPPLPATASKAAQPGDNNNGNNKAEEEKKRLLKNELKEQIQQRKEKAPKKSFWDRLR